MKMPYKDPKYKRKYYLTHRKEIIKRVMDNNKLPHMVAYRKKYFKKYRVTHKEYFDKARRKYNKRIASWRKEYKGSSVKISFRLLQTLYFAKDGMNYKVLSIKTGLHKATICRYMGDLVKMGFVEVSSFKVKAMGRWYLLYKPTSRLLNITVGELMAVKGVHGNVNVNVNVNSDDSVNSGDKIFQKRRDWSSKEIAFLESNKDKDIEWLMKELNRSHDGIRMKLLRLGHHKYHILLRERVYDKIKEFNDKGIQPSLLQLKICFGYDVEKISACCSSLYKALKKLTNEGYIIKLKFNRFMVSKTKSFANR